jgi:Flp pilus assembly protein TadB
MKFVPRSIIGWFFIIFLTSGLIINSSSTGIIDYILMFLFSYTVVIIFSNIFSSDNSKSRNNTPNKKATPSEEEKLSEHLAQLEEVERIKNLKDDIKSKRESLGLISLEHYEALLKKIKSQQKLIKTINEQINSYTSDKNFSQIALLIFIPVYFLIIYFQISSFETFGLQVFMLTIVGCTLFGYFIFMRYRKFKNLLFEAQEKIKIETLVLKDLKLEKKKNQLD